MNVILLINTSMLLLFIYKHDHCLIPPSPCWCIFEASAQLTYFVARQGVLVKWRSRSTVDSSYIQHTS